MHESGWRVLDFTKFNGELRYERGRIAVYDKHDSRLIQVPLIQTAVVLIGASTRVSGAVLMKLAAADVSILVCDWRHVPVAGAYPWSEHSRIGARHRAQAELAAPRLKNAWGRIVSAKITGQARTLELLRSPVSRKLQELSKSVHSGAPENKEALAARIYWSAVTDNESFRRLPGSHDGGINGCLDYAYTILRGHGIRAVVSAGLCGSLGVHHHGRSNQYALVDDLIEPFRPIIDAYVFCSMQNHDLENRDVKQQLVMSTTLAFDSSGKSIPTIFTEFAQNYGMYVEGKTKYLEVPTWNGILSDAQEG